MYSWDDGKYDSKKDRKPTRLWVTTLADYKEDIKEGDIALSSREQAVEMIMAKVRDSNPAELKKLAGDGYNDWFNEFDGSIGIGYRMHWEPSGGWDKLLISLIHAYYGK